MMNLQCFVCVPAGEGGGGALGRTYASALRVGGGGGGGGGGALDSTYASALLVLWFCLSMHYLL